MKKSFKPALFGMAVAMGITGVGAGSAQAAQSTSELDWSYNVPADLDIDSGFRFGHFAGDNLYLWAVEGRNSHMVQSFDQENGAKDHWVYDFRGKAKKMTADGFALQDKNGNSYFVTKKDQDKLYKLDAVDAEGKLKWSKELPDQQSYKTQALDSGDIVMIGTSPADKNTGSYQTFYTFGPDGTLKSTKKVTGAEIQNEGAFLTILPSGQVLAQGKEFQIFKSLNDLKKPFVSYTMPKWVSIDFDVRAGSFDEAIYSLGGGETLIQTHAADYSAVEYKEGVQEIDPALVKQSKALVLFGADGQKKWERSIDNGAAVVPTADGFVLQNGNKLELYGKDNKLKTSKTFEGQDLWLAKAKTTDEVVLTSKKAGTFQALDSKDLSVKYELDMNQVSDKKATYSFLYEGAGELYVHAVDGNVNKTVSHYTLK